MKERQCYSFTAEEYRYTKIVTVEEFAELPREDQKAISNRARISPVVVEPLPLVIIDNIAYVISKEQTP